MGGHIHLGMALLTSIDLIVPKTLIGGVHIRRLQRGQRACCAVAHSQVSAGTRPTTAAARTNNTA
jgi:hypothetical protein